MIQMNDRAKPITQDDVNRMVGIVCDRCGCDHFLADRKWKPTRVTHTKKRADAIQRRRVCRQCGYVMWTTERKDV